MAKPEKPMELTPQTLSLAEELADRNRLLSEFSLGGARVEARQGRDSLWLIIRYEQGPTLALRTAHSPGGGLTAMPGGKPTDSHLAFVASSIAAEFRVEARLVEDRLLRVTTRMTPAHPLLITFWPRDLYPLGEGDDPTKASGEVLAAQRGFNAPVVFLRTDGPAEGAALYFQNLTSLNPWFKATKTKPDGVVGGQWPELGYQPPASPNSPSPPEAPLVPAKEITLSDVFLSCCAAAPRDEVEEARLFIEGLAQIYPYLDQPKAQFRDWPAMAERGLRHLARSPKASVQRYGHRYLRPYTDAEVPDSMVQLAALVPVRSYGVWRGRAAPVEKQLRGGVGKFFDPRLGSIRRYLPNVAEGAETIKKAKDKDPNETDSWYLYHPLANLGRLALAGDQDARRMLEGSLDFAIKVARHFKYQWPILFDITTLKVKTATSGEGKHGQSDVGGLYAYVMLQAFELTGNKRFLKEARKGIEALQGHRFNLLYQANLTAWGVMACGKLWKLTGEAYFHDRIQPLVAGFFHNTVFWESDLGAADHYQTFLGVTCLHDAPYMAIYECFESFDAFRDYLALAGDDASPAERLLMHEYCRFALSRAWGFYPSELPKEELSAENRNGHIDPKLAFPLEDLYADGRSPGEVGQEIYGVGAAFVFTARAFHRVNTAPFVLFCDYPLENLRSAPGECFASIEGCARFDARIRLIGQALPEDLTVRINGRKIRGHKDAGGWEASAPGKGRLSISWPA